jgi:benzodiazapine receptor
MTLVVIVAALITMIVLAIGGAVTAIGPWYRDLRRPSWNPPNWAFGPAWTLILGLAAWSGVLAWTHAAGDPAHGSIALLFGVNIGLQVLWSPLFFSLRRPDWALIEVPFLWLSIAALIVGLAPYSSTAAWLLLPYLLWVSFATFLNFTIVKLNAPFGKTK